MGKRIIKHRGGIGTVPHLKGNILPQQGFDHFFKAAELPHGEGVAFFSLIRNGEVGEDPFGIKSRQCAGCFDLLHRSLIPADILIIESQAAHTCIDLHMDLYGDPGFFRIVGKFSGIVQTIDALRNVML